MITDFRLLSELHDLQDTRIVEYLEGLRAEQIAVWTDARADRDAAVAQGGKRVLDRILRDIAESYETMQKQKQAKPNMNKAF